MMALYLSPEHLGFNLELLEVSLFKMDQKLGIPIHVPTPAISGHLPCCPFAIDRTLAVDGRLLGQGPRCWWKSRQVAAIALGSAPGAALAEYVE